MWTIDELVDQVRAALTAEYPGAPNGRVRDVPDRRAIRWYATTGLVDRPAAMRGRTALYGRRHLLQVVAVKRRQAAGHTLAQIQAELAGAPDATLAGIARLPDGTTPEKPPAQTGAPTRPRFWADPRPTPTPPTPTPPTTISPSAPAGHLSDLALATSTTAGGGPRGPAVPLAGVALGDGVVLLLPGRPADDDYAAIAAAARPLLDLLAARGLSIGTRASAPRTDRSSS